MSDVAIRVEGLGKRYRIGASQVRYRTLRETLVGLATSPARRVSAALKGETLQSVANEIWALRDVTLDIRQGEAVGIIGRNGAGKSTLLKILSRITKPTEGCGDLRGRVGSLLEVGTGFHPELTGRENIFLNGAILGMGKQEIERKFDEIVDFSGIERFLDTVVKRYSSGMYVRLAFSVAAHLEPEILLVDEVLSVGDAEFQKKSMGKMGEVAESGRTVLFVSHNMAAVQNFCQRGIVLQQGRVHFDGSQVDAIAHYLAELEGVRTASSLRTRTDRRGSGLIRFVDVEFRNHDGQRVPSVASGQTFDIFLPYESTHDCHSKDIRVGIVCHTNMGVPVFSQSSVTTRTVFKSIPNAGAFVCHIKRLPLPPGRYSLDISVKVDGEYADLVQGAAEMQVVEGDFFGTGQVPTVGVCLVDSEWRLQA
jgi:lipopolysaccharide transport system ATP-binding protein